MQNRIAELSFSWREAWNLGCNSGTCQERPLQAHIPHITRSSRAEITRIQGDNTDVAANAPATRGAKPPSPPAPAPEAAPSEESPTRKTRARTGEPPEGAATPSLQTKHRWRGVRSRRRRSCTYPCYCENTSRLNISIVVAHTRATAITSILHLVLVVVSSSLVTRHSNLHSLRILEEKCVMSMMHWPSSVVCLYSFFASFFVNRYLILRQLL